MFGQGRKVSRRACLYGKRRRGWKLAATLSDYKSAAPPAAFIAVAISSTQVKIDGALVWLGFESGSGRNALRRRAWLHGSLGPTDARTFRIMKIELSKLLSRPLEISIPIILSLWYYFAVKSCAGPLENHMSLPQGLRLGS